MKRDDLIELCRLVIAALFVALAGSAGLIDSPEVVARRARRLGHRVVRMAGRSARQLVTAR